jgi:alkyl hydroperoxide reductase subunit F
VDSGLPGFGVRWHDRTGSEHQRLGLEGIFVQVGLLPNTEWLRDTLALSNRGEIVIDERGRCSAPGVFAAGDATTVPFKQIIITMGAGSTAALSAFDYLIRHSAPVDDADVGIAA